MTRAEARELYLAIHAIVDRDDCPDAVADAIEADVIPVLCRHAGHDPVPDACGRPEHDYCVRCRAITPGEAPRQRPREAT